MWWVFSLCWSRVIPWGRLLSVEASFAAEIGRVWSVQQEAGGRVIMMRAERLGFLLRNSSKYYSSLDNYLSVSDFMDSWLEIVKPHWLCDCESPVHTAICTVKIALGISSWATNSSCRDFVLAVSVLQSFSVTLVQWHPFSFNLSMVQEKIGILVKRSDAAAARGITMSLRKLLPFCSAEDLMVFIL